ncbi:hypothetical protein C8A01DRAFT_37676 [Parachaetomium inaequale]|uniref:Protein kinase domain-containing protein n=1 Tax=Parachaetomium inaequale TaxID=2588326 RepID=A0AAN6SQ13_9PEZI|nr:hypothetical protein C8A01DRAFT_37676 [Parachaetomium inaequale]
METEIRGDDLIEALAALARNPELLDRARARFDGQGSASPTPPVSPESDLDPSAEAEWRRERLKVKYSASTPYYQFENQAQEEEERLPRYIRPYKPLPGVTDIEQHAHANVKMRWVEQDIWRKEWDGQFRPSGPWQHQMPRPDETQGRLPVSDIEVRMAERNREASRPYHQFIYQVSQERDRIKGDLTILTRTLPQDVLASIRLATSRPPSGKDEPPGAREGMPPDINTMAYERVKSAWMFRKIWNPKWGVLPGMSWMHEVVDDDPAADAPGNTLWAPRAGGTEAASVPPTAPETAPPGMSTSSRRSASRRLDMSIIKDIIKDAATIKDANAVGGAGADPLPEDEAQRAPPPPGPHRRSARSSRGQDARPAGKRQQRSTRKAPAGEGHSLDTERAALGPAHASRVSKRGRPRAAAEPAVQAAPVPAGAPAPRRSKRLQAVADKRVTRGRTAALDTEHVEAVLLDALRALTGLGVTHDDSKLDNFRLVGGGARVMVINLESGYIMTAEDPEFDARSDAKFTAQQYWLAYGGKQPMLM